LCEDSGLALLAPGKVDEHRSAHSLSRLSAMNNSITRRRASGETLRAAA
jgi:hypothetical protein